MALVVNYCSRSRPIYNVLTGVQKFVRKMNLSSVVTSVLQRGVKPLFATSSGLLAQQTRNTFILRRKFPLRLLKKTGLSKRLQAKNFVYELVEDTNVKKRKPVEIILTTYVPGVGDKGQKIFASPEQAYNKYLLPGLAMYASPDNEEKFKDIIEKAKSDVPIYSSPWVPRTLGVLSTHLLTVVVSMESPWTLEKYHIRAAFRKVNIHVPDDAITMPERPITGPDLDKQNKEFYITVTINNREQVKVRCRLHHFTTKEYEKIPFTEFWKTPAPAIYPEDQPILDAMPKHKLFEDKNVV